MLGTTVRKVYKDCKTKFNLFWRTKAIIQSQVSNIAENLNDSDIRYSSIQFACNASFVDAIE